MDNDDIHGINYLHENDIFKQSDPEDSELALLLQTTHQIDKETLQRLVRCYGQSLYRWIGILLFYQNEAAPPHERVLSILRDVFTKAIENAEQFHGQIGVLDWLFGIGYSSLKKYKGKANPLGGHQHPIGVELQEKYIAHSETPNDPFSLDRLPEKLRLPIVLRYVFDFEVDEIASILILQRKQVHYRLKQARSRLLPKLPKAHMEIPIEASIDGILDDQSADFKRTQQHILQCESCRGYADIMVALDRNLPEKLSGQWKFPELDEGDINVMVDVAPIKTGRPLIKKAALLSAGQTAWFAGLGVMFLAMAILFIKLTPAEREFPQAGLTPTPELPPVVKIPSVKPVAEGRRGYINAPQYIDPAFSSDGKWAVFASIKSDPSTQAIILPTIELYDRKANTIQTISEGTAQLRLPWIWWDLAPSISGDGKHIVYVSATTDPNMGGEACATPDQHSCLDIFLYDRITGQTKRLTQSIDGGAANGDSLAPTISEDGNWVAFWSSANNLAEGMTDNCQTSERTITCMYIYLYNIIEDQIERIPVRSVPGEVVFGVDRISLSGDGHYVAFTATALGQASNSPRGSQYFTNMLNEAKFDLRTDNPLTSHASEAVVFNRETGIYELQNQAPDGTPGDGASSSPVLSTDGRYVAFSSESTNLLPGDFNHASDVFIRDRQSGTIELISVSSAGEQGTNNSGLSYWGRGYYSINLSADGRFVAFESTANNLGQASGSGCSKVQASVCYVLYLRDRSTGITEEISALPNGDFSFFPSISSDGRWVTFMQSFFNCSPEQFFCSNVMLFDRQSGVLTNITRNNTDVPSLPWKPSGSVALPWESWESMALAFSPDGNLLALGGYDSKARIWQLTTDGLVDKGTEPDILVSTQKNDPISSLAFSRDSQWLAAGTSSGGVYIWDLADSRQIYSLNILTDPIKKIVFTEDRTSIIVSTLNETWILTIGNKELLKGNVISFGSAGVYAVDISRSGNVLAIAMGDGSVWIQSLPDGNVIGRLEADSASVSSLALSDDGSVLATHSSGGAMNLWQINSSESQLAGVTLMSTFRTRGYVGTITVSPDKRYIISTGRVGEITLWSVSDGQLYTLPNSMPNGMIYSVAFSRCSHKLALVFENMLVLWTSPSRNSRNYNGYSLPVDIAIAAATSPLMDFENIHILNSKDTRPQRQNARQR